ncbi:MAG: chitinase [Clostridia bacterium]|nr:chitinase [Clostridia bacterium]
MIRTEGYISDWAFHRDFTFEQAACLTHVNYSFGLVKEGKVSIAHLKQRERLEKLQRDFPKLKVNLSVGGWGAGGFSPAVATAEGREKLAESAIAVMKEMNLDGIDWDWEYPGSDAAGIECSPDDPQNVTELLVRMREKLDALEKETGKKLEQSIAVGAGRVQDYRWDQALPVLDTVNLMTYDMTGGFCTPVTNLKKADYAVYSVEECVADFVKAGVTREKLLLGAAFYFHVFEGVDEVFPFGKAYEKKGRNFGADQLDESWQRIWDEQTQSAYYKKGNAIATGDDEASLRCKRQYIEREGLAGAIIWELNHDGKNRLLPYIAGKKV